MGVERKNYAKVTLTGELGEQDRDDITSKVWIQGRGDLIIVCLFAFLDKLVDMFGKEDILEVIDLYKNKHEPENPKGELLS